MTSGSLMSSCPLRVVPQKFPASVVYHPTESLHQRSVKLETRYLLESRAQTSATPSCKVCRSDGRGRASRRQVLVQTKCLVNPVAPEVLRVASQCPRSFALHRPTLLRERDCPLTLGTRRAGILVRNSLPPSLWVASCPVMCSVAPSVLLCPHRKHVELPTPSAVESLGRLPYLPLSLFRLSPWRVFRLALPTSALRSCWSCLS